MSVRVTLTNNTTQAEVWRSGTICSQSAPLLLDQTDPGEEFPLKSASGDVTRNVE